jgi:hypothetical protein
VAGLSDNAGVADEFIEILDVGGGLYQVFIDSPRGQSSASPYRLSASLLTIPGPGGPPASGETGPTPWTLLRSDDFSNPARGLFFDDRRGTTRLTFGPGEVHEFGWEFRYVEGSFAGFILGPHPDRTTPTWLGAAAEAVDKVFDDFAAEVRVRGIRSPGQTIYGIRYRVSPEESYTLQVRPVDRWYRILWQSGGDHVLSSGNSSVINSGNEENHLRIEVRGDTLTAFANGQIIDRARHEGLVRRGGNIFLNWAMTGPPADQQVEVRFTDFKVYGPAN